MIKKFTLIGSLLALGVSQALAQTAAPPPAWQQGRSAAMADSKLAPHAGKLTVTAPADIPIQNLKLPAGFKADPHTAVMGLHFYTGNMFPAEYKNAMFIARKGSWNRTKKIGFDMVMVRADADGKNPKSTPFVTGFLDEKADTFWGRPAYILQMPDGSLLLSDEQLGAIYRISYAK